MPSPGVGQGARGEPQDTQTLMGHSVPVSELLWEHSRHKAEWRITMFESPGKGGLEGRNLAGLCFCELQIVQLKEKGVAGKTEILCHKPAL